MKKAIIFVFLSISIFIAGSPMMCASEGSVNFAMRTGSWFNPYTNTNQYATWLNKNFFRMQTTSPYFDPDLTWFAKAWEYLDSYGVPPSSSLVTQHPDWILHDANGNMLYIPFSCNGTSCSQYAADFGNAEYVSWWIQNAQAHVNRGYIGLWVDDVNLDFRVGNGKGAFVSPIDPRTGAAMTQVAWAAYMASFMQSIRKAMPKAEIIHNAIWYAGGAPGDKNPSVTAEIQAADYINLERGISDSGISGGTGTYSLTAFMNHIDYVHSLGKQVIYDEYNYNGNYSLAGYLIMSNGGDCIGNHAASPDNWWAGYNEDLGAAQGSRYTWNGLIRRDFSGGIALLNPPQSGAITVTLPHSYKQISGSTVSGVSLSAGQGAVLLGESVLPSVQIDSAGQNESPYVGDMYVTGGSEAAFTSTVDVSQTKNPAPMAVYQTKRTTRSTPITYTIPGLQPGHTYTVRLHFADDLSTAIGQRIFNVAVNGRAVLSNFDIYATAKKPLTAVITSSSQTPDVNGEISIVFTPGSAGAALISGVEILP